jgi:hypothetical protein
VLSDVPTARLRDLLTIGLAVSTGVHAALVPEHWRERPLLGLGFAVAAGTLAVAAVWLQATPSPLAAIASLLLLAALTAFYLLSRTRGMPVTGREEWDAIGIATQVLQLAAVAAAAALVRAGAPLSNRRRTTGGTHAEPTHA